MISRMSLRYTYIFDIFILVPVNQAPARSTPAADDSSDGPLLKAWPPPAPGEQTVESRAGKKKGILYFVIFIIRQTVRH